MGDLKGFLDEGTEDDAPPPDDLAPDAGGAAPPGDPPAPAAPPPDEDPTPIPDDVRGLRAALVATRKDYKGERDRANGELTALKAQLEELKRTPPAPPPAAPAPAAEPQAVPDALEDPAGYARHLAQVEGARLAWDNKLNMSEEMLKDKEGDEAVDAAKAKFIEMVKANPALYGELQRQRNPYKWMFGEVRRAEAAKEIGADPAAWMESQRAAIRAELQAAGGGAPVPAAGAGPAPGIVLPKSLSGAQSVGGRAVAEETVPEFEEIFSRKRKA